MQVMPVIALMLIQGAAASLPFGPGVFSPDEGCQWAGYSSDQLRMNEAFIAGPAAGQDRAEWLKALRGYREAVRSGAGMPVVQMTYDGVRAWTRMTLPVAKAFALKPGDEVTVQVEARSLEGNPVLCIAFDYLNPQDAWTGWSTVAGELPVPTGGAWHKVAARIQVPLSASVDCMVRPILGMDATHDATRGTLEIRQITLLTADEVRQTAACQTAQTLLRSGLDRSVYDRPDLDWAARMFTCHFTFMYDRAFYDPEKGYTLDAFLDDGEQTFGGYDALVFWQGYPRLGVDERNQFDMYADMPGGLEGLRALVDRCHARGVRVFIDYNPWDRGTRRPDGSDEEAVARVVAALNADGVFLDTMLGADASFRAVVDQARPGVVFAPEGHPAIEQLGVCNVSWAQWLTDPNPPGLLHHKWIEPRHIQHQIRRWNDDHRDEIETAFFNGSGMLVWENVFGVFNPWRLEDATLWRRASAILHAFVENVTSDAWEPFYPTLQPGLFAHRWPGKQNTLYTLRDTSPIPADAPLLTIPPLAEGEQVYDLWQAQPAKVETVPEGVRIYGAMKGIGGFAVAKPDDPIVQALLPKLRAIIPSASNRDQALSVTLPKPAPATQPVPKEAAPSAMAYVPGGRVRMRIEHPRRECGCYPDPGMPASRWREQLWGSPFEGALKHDYAVDVRPFFIDETEVSNDDFHAFLTATGYRPAAAANFLKHWPGDAPAPEQRDCPVVNVSLEDARAYAAWAGKRLPTEPEWHLAAQGVDSRSWPWGNEFIPDHCAMQELRPVRSLPGGRSPFGCYHMAGNVWEWTESERDDGHTRFVIIRGGSWFNAQGSGWYVPGGPQPCTAHTKFLLMWPGLDRCSTIGFRCVRDAG